MKSIDYKSYLIQSLKDPEEAAGYLNAALEGGDLKVFFIALQHVAQAQGGITQLAQKAKKSRSSLYKAFSEKANPHLKSTHDILSALGFRLTVLPNHSQARSV